MALVLCVYCCYDIRFLIELGIEMRLVGVYHSVLKYFIFIFVFLFLKWNIAIFVLTAI